MLKKLTLLIAIILFLSGTSFARAKLQGIAGKGGKTVKTSTSVSYELLETYPNCAIDVYLTGTTTHATIYSDNSGTVKANPFSSNSIDASWSFYVNNGRYDIKFSGTGITIPFTLSDYIFLDDVVIGPASSTDNAIARFDGTTGKIIQNSLITISDIGDMDSLGKVFKLGDNTNVAASRMEFRSQSNEVYSFGVRTSNFTNGPVTEVNYKDNVLQYATYNSADNGTKITPNKVSFGWANESDWYPSPVASDKQSEHYFFWSPPDNSYTQRPFGFIIKHTTGETTFDEFGTHNFYRDHLNGGTQWGFWNEAGLLDLSIGSAAGVVFRNNNCSAFTFRNAAGSNTLPAICLNSSDVWQLFSGGQNAVVGSQTTIFGDVNGQVNVGILGSRIDANTYIRFPGSNLIRFFTNSTKKLELDPDGIITTSPLFLDVDGAYDWGKVTGTNRRPNNLYVKLITESATFVSTVATGTAPLVISSTTPVANLIASNHSLVYDIAGNLQSSQKLISSSATLSAGTIVVTFTGASIFANTNYRCVGSNKTNANPFKIVNTSASSITITGTGTDTIDFNCLGN